MEINKHNKHTFGTLGVYEKGIETKTKGLCIDVCVYGNILRCGRLHKLNILAKFRNCSVKKYPNPGWEEKIS